MSHKVSRKTIRVSGKLKEVVTIQDEEGHIIEKYVTPLMVEFYPRDIMQVIVGASILAIPVAFTEEVWRLGGSLPTLNILGLALLSIIFVSSFVYYNSYRRHIHTHLNEFLKRVIFTYILAYITVAIILLLIDKAPWATDWVLAAKRTAIVAFPASMSAAVADMIK